MKIISTVTGFLRTTAALAAVGAVLFLAVVGGLHVHDHHAVGDCHLCLQLFHLGLESPRLGPETVVTSVPADLPDALPAFRGILVPACDAARAPPTLS